MLGLVLLYVLLDSGFNVLVGLAGAFGVGFDDVGFGHLAGVSVRDGDDGAVRDVGMTEEVGFQFCWSNLMALEYVSNAWGMGERVD